MKTATGQRKIQTLYTYGSVKNKARMEERESIKEICLIAVDPTKTARNPNKKQLKDRTQKRGKMG